MLETYIFIVNKCLAAERWQAEGGWDRPASGDDGGEFVRGNLFHVKQVFGCIKKDAS